MKYIKFSLLVLTFFTSCELQQIEIDQKMPNEFGSVIYASEAPYYLSVSSDCSLNRINLQAVINDANSLNKRLVIDKGNYCIDGSLYIPSNLEIDFSNATIERMTGNSTQIFDLITNIDPINGDSLIVLKNLIIDGNYKEDNLDKINDNHRFSGLKLDNCKDVNLANITVTGTVNAEHLVNTPAAGIFVLRSANVTCNQINGSKNGGTAIIFWDSEQVSVNESINHNNTGSGLAATSTHHSEFFNLNSYNNNDDYVNSEGVPRNYSNITINGLYNKVLNVETWNSDASGLNIGHVGNPSDYTLVDNVHSYNNALEGITITGSKYLIISNIHLSGNKRHNMMIHEGSTHVQIDNALIYGFPDFDGSKPFGIYIKSGGRHGINNANIYNNHHGIYIHNVTSPVSIGSEVFIYNNGASISTTGSGIRIIDSQLVSINNPKIFCDQATGSKTQKYGIFVSGSNNLFIRADIWGNDIEDFHIQNSGSTNDILIY